jgi:hypothetical protein
MVEIIEICEKIFVIRPRTEYQWEAYEFEADRDIFTNEYRTYVKAYRVATEQGFLVNNAE